MDFFERQHAARKHTGRLLILFFLAVVLIITAVHLLVVAATQGKLGSPILLLVDSVGTILVILCGVGISYASLSSGGSAVAESCGGRRLDPATRDPQERRLLNVVEEMSIASGVPVPPVYVIDDEDAINAFAAGLSTSNAAVAVTRGALEQLTRDELQGVIGHEFSHILNGDMRLNLHLASWLAGIMGLAVVGEVLVRLLFNSDTSSGRRRRSSGSRDDDSKDFRILLALFLIGVGLYLIGYIGVFFARIIQAAVSRQREFLADASSVQFTRNPDGLANALKKIASFSRGSAIQNPHGKMLRHMFFCAADKPSWLDSMLATHPPVQERIQWLDPSFNPEMARLAAQPPPLPADTDGKTASTTARPPDASPAGRMTAQIGSPQLGQLLAATAFMGSLSKPVTAAARDPHGASALVYALLLSDEEPLRAQQLQRMQAVVIVPVWHDFEQLLPQISSIKPADKLPLIEMAIAGLRSLSRPDYDKFQVNVKYLVESDGALDLFEYTLQKALRRHLDVSFGKIPASRVRYQRLDPLQTECIVLLSCLAHQGQRGDPAGATAAYQAGLKELDLTGAPTTPLPQELCKLDALDAALDKFDSVSFPLKKKLMSACVAVTSTDGVLGVEETELLRAISDTLDCPVPPPALPAAK